MLFSLYIAQKLLNNVHVGFTDNSRALTGQSITITIVAQAQKSTKGEIWLTIEGRQTLRQTRGES